ncbi:arf-GAP with coiled-coil, ANK repeat and PH domain-containing protein 2 isoform X12 [Sciurus carolinensis]|uniref:arf-GAP with coiled-coil, ANK repeat and PH domain-containing protein 2 isoform X12 n=1 Tax=Sciurus carolinensis TaxID=30640 RepID=UPI001FB3A1DB|nr:arf-GAP with coiled-coil, ANK repeat and PH domain-containing protein 2 isoform X12 [Sciurus carolinensis]
MKMTVDFEECLKDSPRFRAALEEVEGDVAELELKLDKLVKLCIAMIDTGKAFCVANKQFINGIRDLAQYSSNDAVVETSLTKFSDSLQEMINFHTILFDQTQRSIKAQLQNFVKEDLRKFKDAKKQFEKVSEEKENALVKNAQVQRNKQHEVEEATNILTATRKCFRHIALDYVLQLDRLAVDAAKEKREMEQKHSTIQQKDFSSDDSKLEYNVDAANGIVMEGYLFKRASNAFKTWNRKKPDHIRRWFSIQNNQLVYQKKFKDNPTVVVEDLRLCTVKHCEDIERRFCFEVVSPTKSCMLQADSEKLRQAWIKAVQTSIATAYREKGDESEKLDKKSSPSTGSLDSGNESKEKLLKGESALQRVQCIPGNASCCDCGLADPRWASINLGITLCIECSGIHRSLGVHFSKVRSLTLDTWEPELLKLMCELGNDVINRVYEANVEKMGIKKPQPGQRQEKEAYIRAKYVERKFVDKYSISSSPPEQEKKIVSKGCEEKRLSISKLGPSDQVRASTQSSVVAVNSDEARRESLFCPDELDSLFSYFDTSSKLRSIKSNDSGIQQSSDDGRESLPSVVSANSLYESEGERQDSSVFLDSKHLNPGLQLYRASYEKNLPKMAEALAHGADVNWANSEENKATPLIQAVLGGSLVTCEFLLQNGANVNQRDVQGRGPLHHATVLGHTGQVCLFLKRGANQHATDEEGKDPLSIAVEAANADIVTLLRLARMNEEMRESEGLYGQPGDETYQDIFRDFSQMASNNPEKLNRFQQESQKF